MRDFRAGIFHVDCVDPALKLSREERRTLERLAARRPSVVRLLKTSVVPLLAFFAAIVGPGFVLVLVLDGADVGGPIAGKLLALALLPLGVIAYRRVACAMRRPYLSEALALLRFETCIRCGYSLAGQQDKERPCPECGQRPAALICRSCGHWLGTLSDEVMRCPNCDAARAIPRRVTD